MKYHSHGKLLLTGEYLVLEGATSLALPTRLGQSLEVTPSPLPGIGWTSLDHRGKPWLSAHFLLNNDNLKENIQAKDHEFLANPKIIYRLEQLLAHAHSKNPEILQNGKGYEVITKLDFDSSWGLGSSSTLVNNLAQWFKIDAYDLLEHSFGGSGYDIASAQHDHPITYSLTPKGRSVLSAPFNPSFQDHLFFVHLNRKQNTRHAVAHFRKQPETALKMAVNKLDGLTHQIIQCDNLQEFELLLNIHETLLSRILNLPKVKQQYFSDFSGSVKSLGGWGGDFVLATGASKEKEYFKSKGYETILSYGELIF